MQNGMSDVAQITLLLSRIEMMKTISELGANKHFFPQHLMVTLKLLVMQPYVIPSVEGQKQSGFSSPASL